MLTAVILYFDGIIALLVGAIPIYWIEVWRKAREGKAGARPLFAALLGLLWIALVYGSFIEPHRLVVERYAVDLGTGHGQRLRMAVVSDLHFGSYRHEEWARRVVAKINETDPDVVLLPGDLVMTKAGMTMFGPLADLHSRHGVYAALGNWDYARGAVEVRHAIEAAGVEVLTNESVALDVGGATVRLVGVDDLQYGDPDWEAAMSEVAPSDVAIAVVHNPDAALAAEAYGVPLVVAGHTHAGQVRIPFFGPIAQLPTHIGRHYDRGLFPIGPTTLFITPGAGESRVRARLLVPPEVSVLDVIF
jgi:predicted MPP superfamily phosphohydrolase